MQKIKFETDYQEGCNPKILDMLSRTNLEQTSGYGVDDHCKRAKDLIRKFINRPDAKVFFMLGGTQTNTTVIKSFLNPVEGVISVDSGHINVHESGAIESTGHKILTLPNHNGLLDPEDLRKYLAAFYADETHEHSVQPGLVYISFSSELGTLYTRQQLEKIKSVCNEYDLKLFLDGARLGAGLVSESDHANLEDISRLCDAFYIGATKNGALFGEAVIFPNPETLSTKNLKTFRTFIKQQCGLLAKGRIVGLQFEALFDDDNLYIANATHSYKQAMKIKRAFNAQKIPFLVESFTNQQFPILTQEQHKILSAKFDYETWRPLQDNKLAVRFCTSWATTDEAIENLIQEIKTL